VFVLAALALCAPAARAQGAAVDPRDDGRWERWSLGVGGFLASLDTEARIGFPGVGVQVDVEKALGLDTSQSVFRIDSGYRFGGHRRHRLDFTWFDLSRDGEKTLEEQVDIGGMTYPIGTRVTSTFDLAFYNLRYSYSFLLDDRIDLAASFGLHVTELGLTVNAAAIGAGGDSVTAPLPVFGGRLDVLLGKNWYFRSSLEALYLEISDFSGVITDLVIATEWRAWKNFAFGLGLNSVRLGMEVDDEAYGLNFNGSVESRFTGLLFYGKLLF
jgi:hypothetical protein